MTIEYKCDTCIYYDTRSILCDACFENEYYEKNRYRWHDLKKDPTDLPNDEEKVLTYVEDKFGDKIFKHYKILYFSEDLYRVDNYDFIVYQGCNAKGFYYVDSEYGYIEEEPLAWKYIEPFGV